MMALQQHRQGSRSPRPRRERPGRRRRAGQNPDGGRFLIRVIVAGARRLGIQDALSSLGHESGSSTAGSRCGLQYGLTRGPSRAAAAAEGPASTNSARDSETTGNNRDYSDKRHTRQGRPTPRWNGPPPPEVSPRNSRPALPHVQSGDRPADDHPLDFPGALEDREDSGLRGKFPQVSGLHDPVVSARIQHRLSEGNDAFRSARIRFQA